MIMAPQTYINKYKDYSYPQLIAARNELMVELINFEREEKLGSGLNDRIFNPSQQDLYQNNLYLLQEIVRLMDEKYEDGILMVNEEDEDEQLLFINYQIWPEDGVVNTKSKKFKYAKKLLKKLVDAGNPRAMNDLGAMYYEGRTVAQSYKKAVEWYKKAADAGCDAAMSNLGYAYFYGNGVKADTYMAFKYFTMASHRGNLDAVVKLGDMYREGICVNKDERMAFELYRQCYDNAPHDASTNAYPSCLIKIAECLAYGIGTETNKDIAIKLLYEARQILETQIKRGDYFAPRYLERAEKTLEKIDNSLESVQKELSDLKRCYDNMMGKE